MKHIISIVFLFFVFQTLAQKITNKSFSSEGVSTLIIDGSTIFKISIETTKTKTISIQSIVEGENNEHVVLLAEIKNYQLLVSSAYQPLYVAANDKLSVHKLISIELQITIPENFVVSMSSNIASVFMSGNYKQVTAELLNGSFNAENFYGNLVVNTIHGDIDLATNNATIEASSKYGIMNKDEFPEQGKHQISLNSINGNITVTKTE